MVVEVVVAVVFVVRTAAWSRAVCLGANPYALLSLSPRVGLCPSALRHVVALEVTAGSRHEADE